MIFGKSAKKAESSRKTNSPDSASRARKSGEGEKVQAETRTPDEPQTSESVPNTPSGKEDTWASLFQGLESGRVQRAVESSEPSRPVKKAPAVSESATSTATESTTAERGRASTSLRRRDTTDSMEAGAHNDRDAGFGPLSWRKDGEESESAEDRESILDNVRA